MCRFQAGQTALILAAAMLTAIPGRCEPLAGAGPEWSHNLDKGRSLCRTGQFREAQVAFDSALSELKRLQAQPGLIAAVYDERGTIFKVTGQYQEAERDYLRAQSLLEKEGGRKGMGLALVLSHLGAFYMETGLYSRAEDYLNESRAMIQASAMAGSAAYAPVLQNLAVLSFERKEYAKAESLFRESLGILRQDENGNRWHIAVIEGNLASVLAARGQRQQALAIAEQSSAVFRNSPGTFPNCFIATLLVRARVLHSLGRDAEAAQDSEEALRLGEQVLGFDNPKLAPVLTAYSTVLSSLHRHKESKEMEKRAEQLRLEHASRTHAADLVDVSALVRSAK